MIADSIRWQIQAWHGALLVLITTILLTFFWGYERAQRLSRVDERLQSALLMVLPAAQFELRQEEGHEGARPPPFEMGFGDFLFDEGIQPPHEERRPPRDPKGQRERPEILRAKQYLSTLEATSIYTVALNDRHHEVMRTSNAPGIVYPPDSPGTDGESRFRTRSGYRELMHFRPRKDVLIVGTSISDVTVALQKLALRLLGIGLGVVALGLLGGWWLASRAIRPIAEISATAERIAEGDLTQRVETHGAKSELGRLAALLNHTFERLHNTFEQQAQFTADASHELRTPISVILAQTELALMRDRSAEEYREALECCHRSGEQMKTVVNALLELARMDAGDVNLQTEDCDVAEVVKEAILYVEPLAEQRQVSIQAELEPLSIKADKEKLKQVLTNLLTNAIKHNSDGCAVSVELLSQGDMAIIRVSDNGAGIPEAILPYVFERFVRADKARSRSEGSTGLGLSIAKAIVDAHGGSISVSSVEGQGAEFVVRLPRGWKLFGRLI